MTNEEYTQEALKTCSATWRGDKVPSQVLEHTLNAVVASTDALDTLKKVMFYSGGEPVLYDAQIIDLPSKLKGDRLFHDGVNVLHGIIGVATEAGELVQAVSKLMRDDTELDRVNVLEEIGDVYWYLAVLLHSLGYTEEQAKEANIAKLRKRYNGGFSAKEATLRDLINERGVLDEHA